MTREVVELNRATAGKQRIEAQLSQVKLLVEQVSATEEKLKKKKQIRATLKSTLEQLFPTRDNRRGLIVALPPGAPAEKINALGKTLASLQMNCLIEIEVYVTGNDTKKNQQEATIAANLIQKELVADTGLKPVSTVARGLAGLPNETKANLRRIDQIVISSESLGDIPVN